jgi:hypothetical protein
MFCTLRCLLFLISGILIVQISLNMAESQQDIETINALLDNKEHHIHWRYS